MAGSRSRAAVITRMAFVCILYLLNFRPWSMKSFQVKNPMPPRMISREMVRVTTGLAAKPVREEYSPCSPIRSNPALQKAETEWNTEKAAPFSGPYRGIKTVARIQAPMPSTVSMTFTIKRTIRTSPPICSLPIESWISVRWTRPSLCPVTERTIAESVTTPIPPVWISSRITVLPNMLQ